MSLDELIKELQRKREIAIEEGFDPGGLSVVIPAVKKSRLTVWEEVADTEFVKHDRGTVMDLQLVGMEDGR